LNRPLAHHTIAVFTDFDGTIAHPDTLNHLTEIFAGVEFRKKIGGKISSGELSLREGICLEVASIRGSFDEVLKMLKRDVVIDASFIPFASWCQERSTPLTVLSGGMQEIIENLLSPFGLDFVRILANRIQIENGHWGLHFRDETPWGHDKGAALRVAKQAGYSTVFVGDGLSDRGAAVEADLVFAKAGLARFCTAECIPFEEFKDFSQVQDSMARQFQRNG
jgi:HAD superfamily phosphoserine phosphatase-like hydrolase